VFTVSRVIFVLHFSRVYTSLICNDASKTFSSQLYTSVTRKKIFHSSRDWYGPPRGGTTPPKNTFFRYANDIALRTSSTWQTSILYSSVLLSGRFPSPEISMKHTHWWSFAKRGCKFDRQTSFSYIPGGPIMQATTESPTKCIKACQ